MSSVTKRFVSALLLVALTSHLSAGERWVSPLTGFNIQQTFARPATPYGAGHRGIDLDALTGETVRAPVDGVVTFVGTVVDRELVTLQVSEKMLLSLEPVSSNLQVGDIVRQRQSVGVVADGGHCDMNCLHIGVRVRGEYVNPLRFFIGKPRLLPWA